MLVELFRDPGATNIVIPDVVSIEDQNNTVKITNNLGSYWIVTSDVYYEIVATPDYSE